MKKIIIITCILIMAVALMLFVFIYNLTPEIKPLYKKVEIHSSLNNESIYIKQKVWGATSDNQIIVISRSPKEEFMPDEQTDYIYSGLSSFLYKQNQDTIFVYTMKESKVPTKLMTGYKIIQIELENAKMMDLIENNNYRKRGLKLIQ